MSDYVEIKFPALKNWEIEEVISILTKYKNFLSNSEREIRLHNKMVEYEFFITINRGIGATFICSENSPPLRVNKHLKLETFWYCSTCGTEDFLGDMGVRKDENYQYCNDCRSRYK